MFTKWGFREILQKNAASILQPDLCHAGGITEVRLIAGMAEAYCVKDKQKVEIQNPQKITMKNGKPATKGTCPKCGGSVFRIGG